MWLECLALRVNGKRRQCRGQTLRVEGFFEFSLSFSPFVFLLFVLDTEHCFFSLAKQFTSKQLSRESAKCEKKEKEERKKIKGAIEKGNLDGARIYAENAIRNKNQVRV